MALTLYKTSRFSRVYREDQGDNTWEGFMRASIAPMHYESVPDSGDYDTAIDVEQIATTTALLDGYAMNGAAYNSELQTVVPGSSTEQPNTQRARGFVTYKRRSSSVAYKALSFGYFRKSTEARDDISAAFDYSTLPTIAENTRDLGSNAAVPSEVITYSSTAEYPILDTISTFDVSMKLGNNPEALLNILRIEAGARAWINANDPNSWPDADTRIGFFLEMDWSNIATVTLANGEVVDPLTDSFTDALGDITMSDSAGNIVGYMPNAFGYSGSYGTDEQRPLTKSFYEDSGTTYCHIGMEIASWDLVFNTFDTLWSFDIQPFFNGRNRAATSEQSTWPAYFSIPTSTSGSDELRAGQYFGYTDNKVGLSFKTLIPGGASVDQGGSEYATLRLHSGNQTAQYYGYTSVLDFFCDVRGSGYFGYDSRREIGGSNWEYSTSYSTETLDTTVVATTLAPVDMASPLQEVLDRPWQPDGGVRIAIRDNAAQNANGYYYAILAGYSMDGLDPVLDVYFTAPLVDKRHNDVGLRGNHHGYSSTARHKSLDKRHND